MPWLLAQLVEMTVAVVTAGVGFVAAAAAGAVVAVVVARMEEQRRRREVRAAERRAELEPVRRYALALQEFIEAAVGVVQVTQSEGRKDGGEGSAHRWRRGLEREWEKVVVAEPQPGVLVYVRDREAQLCILRLRLWGMACRERCLGCLGSGEVMGEEEARERVGFAVELAAQVEAWIRAEVGGD